MDIDTFITKLQEELGLTEYWGYEKCLESVIHTQEQLKMEEERVEELENKIEEQGTQLQEEHQRIIELEEMCSKQQEQIKTLEEIHNGDMKMAKMLKEKWNEEKEKVKKLKEKNTQLENIKIKVEQEEMKGFDFKQMKKQLDEMSKDILKIQQIDEKDKNVYEDMIKKLTIGIVLTNNVNEFQEEIELTNPKSKKWKKGFTKQQVKIYHTILDKMNDTDWNEDNGSCKLFYEEKSKTLGFEVIDKDE